MSQAAGHDDEPIDLAARPATPLWRLGLVWFMRLMAIVWLLKGLLWWADILGVTPGVPLEERRLAARAVAVGFAITDLVAAVGLWLTAVWGGLIWLLSVTTTLVLSFVLPTIVPVDAYGYAIQATVIVVYLTLTALAAREDDRD
jgi:uncharacterized membrane protein